MVFLLLVYDTIIFLSYSYSEVTFKTKPGSSDVETRLTSYGGGGTCP